MSPCKKNTMRNTPTKRTATPGKASFEVLPPAIPTKDIKETIAAEVVVVGAGLAGLTAALSAAEAGAETIIIEKSDTPQMRGLETALNSRLQKKARVKIDKDQVISIIMDFGLYRCYERVVRLWADNRDRAVDGLLDKYPSLKGFYWPRKR